MGAGLWVMTFKCCPFNYFLHLSLFLCGSHCVRIEIWVDFSTASGVGTCIVICFSKNITCQPTDLINSQLQFKLLIWSGKTLSFAQLIKKKLLEVTWSQHVFIIIVAVPSYYFLHGWVTLWKRSYYVSVFLINQRPISPKLPEKDPAEEKCVLI